MERIQSPLIYVAGAYNAPTPEGILYNIASAEAVSIVLIKNGWNVFTPHKNTSGYEQYEGGEISKDTWLQMDLCILERCDALYAIGSWETSKGSQQEIYFASDHSIPVFFEEDYPSYSFSPTVMK